MHYKTGKDYAHAAHLALAANGHALHALALGRAVIDLYAAQEGSSLPGYLARPLERSSSMEVNQAAMHHVTYYVSIAMSSRSAVAELPAYPDMLTSNDTQHLVADGDHELA